MLTADFELGTNGATIVAGDPGNATAWDTVNRSPGSNLTYDATRAISGSQSSKHANGGDGACSLLWSTAFGTQTEYFGRAHMYALANPGTQVTWIAHARTGGTGNSWGLQITTAGKIRVCDQADGTIAVSTYSVNLNAWFRVEWHANNTTGLVEVKLFNDALSGTPTELVVSSSGNGIGADTNSVSFGVGILNYTSWWDGLVDIAPDYPGPYIPPPPPRISAPMHGISR